ncbi:MAG: KamA family radical SAM protein [Gaiellales bacterium]|nr:KamA family radical SAM protein [Gaiellales bacterium]
MDKVTYLTRLEQVPQLSCSEKAELAPVEARHAFRTNTYYLGLIDWSDPDDPIRRIAIPTKDELADWGRLDASDEHLYVKAPGLEHKYESTALLLVSDVCGGFCRFCFRKRLFMDDISEVSRDVSEGMDYIREHPEINNVLLTGGDPLMLPAERLDQILAELRTMQHVQIIRIGSKIPVFNPSRLTSDPTLLETLQRHSREAKRIYLMVHFNHPREITLEATHGIALVHKAGVITANQTPMLRGVNDDPAVLAELFNRLSYIGVAPYYVFIGRPTRGNKHFLVPVEKALEIFEQARMNCSGLAKRARLVMSHASGKIEIVGRTEDHIYMRYHRAADPGMKGRFLALRSNPDALWFDDYPEIEAEYSTENPFRCYGPE